MDRTFSQNSDVIRLEDSTRREFEATRNSAKKYSLGVPDTVIYTSDCQVRPGEMILVDTTDGAVTVTITGVTEDLIGVPMTVKKYCSDTDNDVTIQVSDEDSDEIDGGTSVTISDAWDSRIIVPISRNKLTT